MQNSNQQEALYSFIGNLNPITPIQEYFLLNSLFSPKIIYPLIVQTPFVVHIYKIIFYEKSIRYPFFQHFDFRNGFYSQ